MTVELWARNPHSYIRECVLTGQMNFAWDKGALLKRGIGLDAFMENHAPNMDYRAIVCSDRGAAEYTRNNTVTNPKAVYPVWEYGQYTLDHLEWLMAENREEELRAEAEERGKIKAETPVTGQEHRVIVTHFPSLLTGVGKGFINTLIEMQRDYPHCILHLHGFTSLGWVGYGLRAGDVDLRQAPSRGSLFLPNGKMIAYEEAKHHRRWVHVLGVKEGDLSDPSQRCQASILSAQWAAKNWHKAEFPSRRTMSQYDFESLLRGEDIKHEWDEITTTANDRRDGPMNGDKFLCDACSWQNDCRAYRLGSVCTLPGSTATELSRLFKSRDSGQIIEGLGKMLQQDVERLEEGRDIEKSTGELDEHVTRISEKTFRKAVELAKLIDPKLRGNALVQVNGGNGQVNVGAGQDSQRTLQERVSSAVASLEGAGVPRDNITQEMIQRIMEADSNSKVVAELAAEEAAKHSLPVGLIVEAELTQ